MASIFHLVIGDELPVLEVQLLGPGNVPVNIAAGTVAFKAALRGDPALTVTKPAAIHSAATGTVRVTFAGTDFVTGGWYDYRFKWTNGLQDLTFPNDGTAFRMLVTAPA